jgi:hypothetical protein
MISTFLPNLAKWSDNATLSVIVSRARVVRLQRPQVFKLHTAKSHQPRVYDDRAGPFEVFDVAGDHRQPMNEG